MNSLVDFQLIVCFERQLAVQAPFRLFLEIDKGVPLYVAIFSPDQTVNFRLKHVDISWKLWFWGLNWDI